MLQAPEPCAATPAFFAPVALNQSYRLLNHGPTVLVSAGHDGHVNVMAAAWSMPLDFQPPKVAVVLDKATRTRELVEASGYFVLNVPTRAQAAMTLGVGTDSAHAVPDKLARHQVQTFTVTPYPQPLVQGCVGWLLCRVLPEPRNQQVYDLFLGEVVAAWSDPRVFSDGRWHFETAADDLRTLHYVAGGQFYAIGESIPLPRPPARP